MRVLQISNKAPFPPNDGSSIAIYNMGVGFIANEVDLHVLTINTKKHFKSDEDIPQDYKTKSHYQSVYENTDVSAVGALLNLFSSDSYFVSRFYFKDFENKLIEKLKTNTFDVIQLEGLFVATYIKVIKKYSKAKIVLRAHNIEYLIWERHLKNEKSAFKKWYLGLQTKRLKNFELRVLNDLDAIVTITDFDKTVFEKEGFKKPIYTCITGVDVNDYKKKKSEIKKPKTIFHFASMDWMPNVEAAEWFLNNCWKSILKQVPDAKFVMAGRNMPAHLKKLNEANVLVVEDVPDSRIFYNEHEIMLVPLASGSGLRIKIIEGMAYGKAIVSTSVGAEGIKYTNGKNLMIADLPKDFIKAVVDLLKDEAKRTELEKGAQSFAEQEFDNAKVVSGLVNFYKTVLNA
ncbi:MAG: glycosyltransferase family 4 protein [Bacteroidia bacterium]|nr:glycosyltransferase family 4 protein [Bacteroidia bacterium]